MTTQIRQGGLDLHTRIGKVWVNGVIGNAASTKKSITEVEMLLDSAANPNTYGSFSPRLREGNKGNTFWDDGIGYLTQNAIGLRNPGIETLVTNLPGLIAKAKAAGKHLIVSIYGEHPDDYVIMAEMLIPFAEDISLELNLSCPNIFKGGALVSHDPEASYNIVHAVRLVFSGNLIANLIYDPDITLIQSMASVMNDSGVDALALINTLGFGLVIDPETLKPQMDTVMFGGISGRAINPMMLGTVYRYRRYLDPRISIIAQGGINSGFDILTALICGANVCRNANAYLREGEGFFERIQGEFFTEMDQRGLKSLSDIPRLKDMDQLPSFQSV